MKQKLKRVIILNPQGYVEKNPPLGKTDTGGQTVYILNLAKALSKKNIKVDIFTRYFDHYEKQEELINDKVKIIRIPAGKKKFIPKERLYEVMPEFAEKIMLYLHKTKKKPQIIHSHYWDGGYAGILLSKMLDIPHINTSHTFGKVKKLKMKIEKVSREKLVSAYRFHVRIAIEQKIFNKADAILVLCETSRIQLLHYYIVDFEKIKVIYPGVDIDIFNPRKNALDKKIQLKENSILTMSRLVPAKGIDRLIEALNLIKKSINFNLYIGGDINSQNASKEEKATKKLLLDLIEKYHLKDRVTFLGQLNHKEVAAYYRNTDLFVLPSRYEPFGLTTMEAMACGSICLISNVAGSKEVIIDGLNGFVIDMHDRKLFAKKILDILKNKKNNRKIAQNAVFTIKQHYSWEKIVDNIINFYSSLL